MLQCWVRLCCRDRAGTWCPCLAQSAAASRADTQPVKPVGDLGMSQVSEGFADLQLLLCHFGSSLQG